MPSNLVGASTFTALRKMLGMPQNVLSVYLGVSNTTISGYEQHGCNNRELINKLLALIESRAHLPAAAPVKRGRRAKQWRLSHAKDGSRVRYVLWMPDYPDHRKALVARPIAGRETVRWLERESRTAKVWHEYAITCEGTFVEYGPDFNFKW